MKNYRELSYGNIKKNMLFRGESLYKLKNKDKKKLFIERNIKTVIDLRTVEEKNKQNDREIEGITNYHIPLVTMDDMSKSSKKENQAEDVKKDILSNLPDMTEYYKVFVKREKKEAWTKIFNLLLDNNDGFFFHCTVGKDRTGIVSAVLLSVLGIDKETIYKDYMLTNEHPVIPLSLRVYVLSVKKDQRKKFMEYFYVKEEYLDAAFTEIDNIYGSFNNFLVECCSLDDEKIAKLKSIYLE